ncbi:MAG: metal ABC transporter permease [Limisphaerales bacterium]
MITEFLNSWSLFGPSYLTALAGAVLLSLVGVFVVARDQVFLAAAVSQSSMLGVACALFLGWENPALLPVAFSVGAAIFINHRASRGGVSHQETTGWVFLLASALSILLLVKQPFSVKQVQALTSSTMIGATARDAGLFAALGLGLMGLVFVQRPRLVLWLSDPVMAAAVGMRIGLWSLGAAVALGLGAGLMLRSTGLLFTFGCLVLPALAAKNLSRDVSTMFWLSPLAAVAGVLPGMVLAHHFDLPPGQVIVVVLAFLAALGVLLRSLRETLGRQVSLLP